MSVCLCINSVWWRIYPALQSGDLSQLNAEKIGSTAGSAPQTASTGGLSSEMEDEEVGPQSGGRGPLASGHRQPVFIGLPLTTEKSGDSGTCKYKIGDPGVCRLNMKRQFLVLGPRDEQFSASRYCLASAALLANLTNRVLVAPSVRNGFLTFPAKDALDAADLWQLDEALPGVDVVHARDFLACFPVYESHGKLRASSQELAIRPWRMHDAWDEFEHYRELQDKTRGAKIVYLPEVEMCVKFGLKATKRRKEVTRQLSQVQPCIRTYSQGILPKFSRQSLFFHWRSITHTYHETLINGSDPRFPAGKFLQHPDSHLQQCVRTIVPQVKRIRKTTGSDSVVLFSDIHGGGKGGGYVEFEKFFRLYIAMQHDREKARARLDKIVWMVNGDQAIIGYLKRYPLFGPKLDLDQGLLGMIIAQVVLAAKHFLTCAEGSCTRCARRASGFTAAILRDRAKAQLPAWTSWTNLAETPPGNLSALIPS